MPPKIINQINSFGKSFNSMTIDTVKGFLTDTKNQNLFCKIFEYKFLVAGVGFEPTTFML